MDIERINLKFCLATIDVNILYHNCYVLEVCNTRIAFRILV